MDLITVLADAITRQEGRTQNNNPGNIWDGTGPGKPNRIWPDLPLDSRGFVIYSTPEAGRAALENQLRIKINRGATLTELLNQWDSGDPASNRATYVSNVASWTGLPTDTPLSSIASAPAQFHSSDPAPGPAPGFDVSPFFGDTDASGAPVYDQASIGGELSAGALLGFVAVGLLAWWFFAD
jgi:hypothetical protein